MSSLHSRFAKLPFLAAVLLIPLLIGCSMTHFAFPPGHTMADFERDKGECFWTMESTIIPCMQRKGYRIVTETQASEINRAGQMVARGENKFDIAGFDMRTGELLLGKSEFMPGSTNASIDIETTKSNIRCSGIAELVKATAQGKGTMGKATLICKDGRSVKATFVYETRSSGWGIGVDNKGNGYRFLFGRLNLDHDHLRKEFEKMNREIKEKSKGIAL